MRSPTAPLPTAALPQNPPRIPWNEPLAEGNDEDDDDGCYEAWLETYDPAADAAYPFPPPPDNRPRTPCRPQVHMTDACFDAWLTTHNSPTARPTDFIIAWNERGVRPPTTGPSSA